MHHDDLIIAIDSRGIKITNRAQQKDGWMDKGWMDKKGMYIIGEEVLSQDACCCLYKNHRSLL